MCESVELNNQMGISGRVLHYAFLAAQSIWESVYGRQHLGWIASIRT